MNVTFPCPTCGRIATAQASLAADWQCPACDHRMRLMATEPLIPTCGVCGNHELYKQKDFPHWLGMTILVVALVLSTVTYYSYEKWWSWAFLIGSAFIDGIMYLMVGDVIVCYRCNAHYRGAAPTQAHLPFEITLAERYRQEKIRQERLKSEKP
ncbi:MAG: hypothetical protein HYX68_11545 [Planctomycetes bacterium]|nr:hypothetical protein [Planctomycetota bacterium]